jgi:hypothetical protein
MPSRILKKLICIAQRSVLFLEMRCHQFAVTLYTKATKLMTQAELNCLDDPTDTYTHQTVFLGNA